MRHYWYYLDNCSRLVEGSCCYYCPQLVGEERKRGSKENCNQAEKRRRYRPHLAWDCSDSELGHIESAHLTMEMRKMIRVVAQIHHPSRIQEGRDL